jgi:hypothetical protein
MEMKNHSTIHVKQLIEKVPTDSDFQNSIKNHFDRINTRIEHSSRNLCV